MISRSLIRLKDGSTLRGEVEGEAVHGWLMTFSRITYYHDDRPVSLEGCNYLRNTIGIEGRDD